MKYVVEKKMSKLSSLVKAATKALTFFQSLHKRYRIFKGMEKKKWH